MKYQPDHEPRPLPISMLILTNIPILPGLVTEFFNYRDQRSYLHPAERLLMWSMEFVKTAIILYSLYQKPDLIISAIPFLAASFVEALAINKLIDPDRL